jgi:hypothetical protein
MSPERMLIAVIQIWKQAEPMPRMTLMAGSG